MTSSDAHRALLDTLVNLELTLLKVEVRSCTADLSRLLADDFWEFGASGASFGKDEVLARLPDEACPEFKPQDFELRPLGPGVAQLIYRSMMQKPGQAPTFSLRSSIWRDSPEGWQMVFHQGTNCEPF